MSAAPTPESSTPVASGRALGVLIFGAVVIGFVPILVRLSDTGSAAAGFWRLAFALPLLALIAARSASTPGGGLGGAPSRLAMIAGAMFALDLGFWHYGIALTSVANATVLTNLTPVVVTAFAWIFLAQKPRKLFLLAVGLAIGGAGLMAAARGGAAGPSPGWGNAAAALTALWYAFYFLAVSAARRTEAATRIMFWSSLTGAPLLLLAALALGEPILPGSLGGWAACAGLGLLHVAGQGSIAWALGRLPPATASVVVLIQPLVAAIAGWILFAEALGPLQALGGAITLGGVALAQWSARPRPPVQS
ncbi:DMT family transporter [Phenylobacterium sp.]|uniref:DMT family transporter n=1 Tax=Phenylobacterium sp. TaxID=1871053 RepID=UPI002FD97E24